MCWNLAVAAKSFLFPTNKVPYLMLYLMRWEFSGSLAIWWKEGAIEFLELLIFFYCSCVEAVRGSGASEERCDS